MDIINTTRPATFGAASNTIVTNIFGGFANKILMALKQNRTRRALANLSVRQLDDIGLMPGDIARISRPITLLH